MFNQGRFPTVLLAETEDDKSAVLWKFFKKNRNCI